MNERQQGLYNYLMSKANQDRYITKEEIASDLSDFYPRSRELSSEHKSSAFNNLRGDVRAINSSNAEKIIVSSTIGYKIGTKKEAIKYIRDRFRRDVKSIKLNRRLLKKVGAHDQLQMNNDVIRVIETFVEGAADG